MTAEQLEELLEGGDWSQVNWDTLDAMLKTIRHHERRVIAAEKLVEAGSELQRLWSIDKGGRDLSWRVSLEGSMEDHECALAAYREASK